MGSHILSNGTMCHHPRFWSTSPSTQQRSSHSCKQERHVVEARSRRADLASALEMSRTAICVKEALNTLQSFWNQMDKSRSDFAKPAGHSYSSRRCVRSSGMDSRGFNNFGHCLVRLIDIAGALVAQGAMLRGCRVFPTPRDCFSPKSTTWRAHRFHLLSVACDKAYGMSSCNDDRPVLPLQRSAEHQ